MAAGHGLRQLVPAVGGLLCLWVLLPGQDRFALYQSSPRASEPRSRAWDQALGLTVGGFMGAEPHRLQGMGGKDGGKELLRPELTFHFLKQP